MYEGGAWLRASNCCTLRKPKLSHKGQLHWNWRKNIKHFYRWGSMFLTICIFSKPVSLIRFSSVLYSERLTCAVPDLILGRKLCGTISGKKIGYILGSFHFDFINWAYFFFPTFKVLIIVVMIWNSDTLYKSVSKYILNTKN